MQLIIHTHKHISIIHQLMGKASIPDNVFVYSAINFCFHFGQYLFVINTFVTNGYLLCYTVDLLSRLRLLHNNIFIRERANNTNNDKNDQIRLKE